MIDPNDLEQIIDQVQSEFSTRDELIARKFRELESQKSDRRLTTFIPWTLDSEGDAIRMKETALKRNKALRKKLIIYMGKLRSKQCYNPAEDNLNRMIEKYSEILSDPNVD